MASQREAWPGSEASFFEAMGTDEATEVGRYDGVIFLQSAAVGKGHVNDRQLDRIQRFEQLECFVRAARLAYDDHVVHPAFDLQVAVFAFVGDVARAIPAVLNLGFCFVRPEQVSGKRRVSEGIDE